MMNGNIQNSTETLKSQLKSINYGKVPMFNDLVNYNPAIFLQILHYALIEYSPLVYGYLVQKDFDLYATNDLRFTQGAFKVMIQEFGIKPNLNVNQFLSESFLESKINFCATLINSIKNLNTKLNLENKPKTKLSSKSKSSTENIKEMPLVKSEKAQENKINQPPVEKERQPYKEIFSLHDDDHEDHEALKEMEMPIPTPLNHDLEIPVIEDFTPKSKLPIVPENKSQFAFPDKENRPYYANQEPLEPKRSASENFVQKDLEDKKKEEKSVNNQQTKEILKMILEMNDAFRMLNKKFESFQANVEGWMKNTNAQMTLMETNFQVLKAQISNKKTTSDL